MKVLSYLDPSALFSISHVSRLFYQLANDEALWKNIYIVELGKNKKRKPKCMDELLLKTATLEVHDGAAGHWKWLYFKTVAAYDMKTWKSHLGLISRHTGLPSRTERVLRNLHVTWELTVSDKSGHEGTHEPSWSQFCETSVTLCWSGGGCLPDYQQISTLQLHGVRRIALNCPGLKKPGWRSLMATLDMQALTGSTQVIGQDRLVELKLLQPGIIIGVWRVITSQAAMLYFPFYFFFSTSPYVEQIIKSPFDDIDPEYGLHGYQLHIVLHNTACEIMSGSFHQMFCQRSNLFPLIFTTSHCSSRKEILTFAYSSTSFQNCCIMSLTLLDEFKKPFWCVGSPVSMELEKTPVSYDYDGEHFSIHHQDSDGQVKMKLVWMEEQKQLALISLVVYVTVCKVNEHFSRNY
uniref:F-box domain-containing protein n=1 Tax=Cyclopterus lumpus TaxID=8103 RepID=A0A8C2ZLU6_CYCLU